MTDISICLSDEIEIDGDDIVEGEFYQADIRESEECKISVHSLIKIIVSNSHESPCFTCCSQ